MRSASDRRAWWWLVPLLAAFAICVPALSNAFAWDDLPLIVFNQKIQDEGAVKHALTSDFWDSDEVGVEVRGAYYRPVIKLLQVAQWRLFGAAPFGWHLINAVLHALVTALGAVFLRRRLGSSPSFQLDAAACCAALIWALHPARVENVAWVCGTSDEWMLLFALGALLIAQTRWWLAVPLFALAALCKEAAYLLPVMVLADWALKRESLRRFFAAALGTLVALVIRLAVRGPPASSPGDWGGRHVTDVLAAFGFYGAHAIWPWQPSVYSGAFGQRSDGSWVLPSELVLVGAVMAAGAIGLALLSLRRNSLRPWLADLAWFIVPLLPVLHLIRPLWSGFASERFLALPLLGVAASAARGLSVVSWPRARLGVVVAVALSVLFGLISAQHMRDFKDNETLWSFELLVHPENVRAQESYANHLVSEHRWAEAAAVLKVAAQQPGLPLETDRRVMALAKSLRGSTPESDRETWGAIGTFYRAVLLGEGAPTLRVSGTAYVLSSPPAEVVRDVSAVSVGGDFAGDSLEGLARGGQLQLAVRLVPKVLQAPNASSRRFVLGAQVYAWSRQFAEAKRAAAVGAQAFPSPEWANFVAAIDEAQVADQSPDLSVEATLRRARAWNALRSRRLAREALAGVRDPFAPEVARVRMDIALADGDENEANRIAQHHVP